MRAPRTAPLRAPRSLAERARLPPPPQMYREEELREKRKLEEERQKAARPG